MHPSPFPRMPAKCRHSAGIVAMNTDAVAIHTNRMLERHFAAYAQSRTPRSFAHRRQQTVRLLARLP